MSSFITFHILVVVLLQSSVTFLNNITTCQLCEKKGHIAKYCKNENHSTNLADTFSACSLSQGDISDWYVDSGASAHMTNSTGNLDSGTPYSGHEQVAVGNGNLLNVSH